MSWFQPRRLESLAFTSAVNDVKVNLCVIPNAIVSNLWPDYLNSDRVSCLALLDYVDQTGDFNGALKCILKHNTYREDGLRFEWNLKGDIDCCVADDYGLTAHRHLQTYFKCNLSELTKLDALKFVMTYMYALSESPQFLPRQLMVWGYNVGGKCCDCDEEGVYEYEDVFYEMLWYEKITDNQFESIKELNKLLLRDTFRCECGTFLVSQIDAVY